MGNPVFSGSNGIRSVDATRFLRADFYVSWNAIDASFILICPTAATVALSRLTPAPLPLAGGPILTNGTTVLTGTDHQITVTAAVGTPMAGQSTLTLAFKYQGIGSPPAGHWVVQSTVAAAGAATVEDDGGQSTTFGALLVDPQLTNNTIAPGAPVPDGSAILLDGVADYTVVTAGALMIPAAFKPSITGKWTQVGPATTSADPSGDPAATVTATGTPVNPKTSTLNAPVVYGRTNLTFALVAFYKDATDYSAFANTGPSLVFPVIPRNKHIAIVVDRSGSMAGTITGVPGARWDWAVRAAHAWADLYVAFRKNLTDMVGADRVGIMIFENGTCGWGAVTSATDIKVVIPGSGNLGPTGSLDLNPLDIGSPGSCTPIGDALISALTKLGQGGNIPADDQFVVVLLTDGYENSGKVYVDESGSAPMGATSFTAAWSASPTLTQVRKQAKFVALGLGSWVQENVLNELGYMPPMGATTPAGMYKIIHDPRDLASSIAQGFKFALDAEELIPTGKEMDEKTWYYTVDPNEHRASFVVMGLPASGASDWDPTTDAVELWYRLDTDPVGSFTNHVSGKNVASPLGVSVSLRLHHGIVTIDLPTLLGVNVSHSTEWKLQHSKASLPQVLPSGGGPRPLNALAMVDLWLSCNFTFDKPVYGIGETMQLTCRIAAGGAPVTGATVEAILEKPGEGLGTFLAVNGGNYAPVIPKPSVERRRTGDPPHPKLAMRNTLLAQHNLTDLPLIKPANIFTDGSNQLHDSANTGAYSNTFATTDKEGSYTFIFRASGPLPHGLKWARTIALSKWVGVTVDPAQSPVTLQFGQPAPAGMLGVQISLRPRSSNGEFLGPFRDGSVRMVAEGGVLQGLIGHYDGTYTNVLYYKPGEVPKVGITVGGVRFPPEVISPNPICRKLGRLPRLYEELIEELEDLICCRHGKRKGFLHELLEYLEKLEEKSPIAHHLIDKLRRLFRLG